MNLLTLCRMGNTGVRSIWVANKVLLHHAVRTQGFVYATWNHGPCLLKIPKKA